jgi:hypothetical protein
VPSLELASFRRSTTSQEEEMSTGKKAASDAGRVLADPNSTKKEKEIAASDLAQAKKKK